MAMTASQVLNQAAALLIDAGMTRWSQDELLDYLNAGRREACVLRPDLYAITANLTLAAGATQALPAGGFKLFDVFHNYKADGSVGNSPRVVERELLDAARPGWRSDASVGYIKHFMYDERDGRSFDVYPPAAAGLQVRVRYAAEPDPIAVGSLSTELAQEGPYASYLVDYVCARAMTKDAEYAGNRELVGGYFARFTAGFAAGVTTETAVSPNTANQGGVPSRAAALASA